MRSRTHVKDWTVAPVAIILSTLLLCPTTGMAVSTVCNKTAAEICPTASSTSDCDGDGISDYDECNGLQFQFSTSALYSASLKKPFPGWKSTNAEKLDPAKPDLFYILLDSGAKDLLTTSALYLATKGNLDFYSSGLQVNTHRILKADYKAGSDRVLMSDAAGVARLKAAVLIDNTTTGVSLGLTKEGAPQGPLSPQVTSTIYTARIKANVNTNCPTGRFCSIKGANINNATATGGYDNTPIINYFIRQVAAHELAHASYLALPKTADPVNSPCNCPADNSTASTTNYHYADQSLIMAAQTTFGTAVNASGVTEGMYEIGTVYDPKLDTYGLTLK